MSCRCHEEEQLFGVGALTDAGSFVDRVHREIMSLDVDVQHAIENNEEPLRPGFNFNEWNSFVNDRVNDGITDADDSDYLQPRPHGWLDWRGSLSNFDFIARANHTTQMASRFELEYARLRETFKFAGGVPTTEDPEHPGIDETPAEAEARKKGQIDYIKWGLIIASVTAAGYLLSSAAPLLPRRSR
jgi:hypothetical protein